MSVIVAAVLAWPIMLTQARSDEPPPLIVAEQSCEYAVNPIGIDTPQPRFGWVLQSNRRGTIQQAYRILVAHSPHELASDRGSLWDSGRVISGDSVNIRYQGPELFSRQQCWWKVRVWDDQGHAGPWSESATFEMGLLQATDWHGQWIGLGGENTSAASPLLRRKFLVGGPVKRARLYAAGIGWSEYYLNGQRIGNNVLDPGATDFDKRILYVSHDVTQQIQPGHNIIGVMIGNGWYSEPPGPNYGDSPRLLLELVVELADGTMQRVVSDDDWMSSTGPILQNDFFHGEIYDARLEKTGWLSVDYDDSAWIAAEERAPPGGRLESQMLEPIQVTRVLQPVKLTNPKPGVYVYDFGQLFGGWARLRVKGPAGTRIALRYAERLFPEGDLTALQESIQRDADAKYATRVTPESGLVDKRHHRGMDGATDYYILKGDLAGECYEPRFTLHPVRYVQIEGFPGELTLENLEGCVVHNAIDMSGDFRCSNPLLNQIHRNCLWTYTNGMYSITLDCLYREHWGWLEPASTPSMLFARRHTPRYWEKFLRDVQCAQHADGVIPDVIPAYPLKGRKTGDPAWAGNYPLVVWYVYQTYGDPGLLAEHYPNMKRWLGYLSSIANGHHRIETGGYYGDHMLPGDAPGKEQFISPETPPALLWTGFYYNNAWILSQAASILAMEDDAAKFGRLADSIRSALNEKWFDEAAGRYALGTQTANIFPLALGVVPAANRHRVLEHLIDDIENKRNGHFHAGNVGITCLVDSLSRLGASELLYRVVNSTDYPGWGYMVRQGATTIWESWGDAQEGFVGYNTSEASMEMFGSINEFFYNDLAGIQGPDYYGNRSMPMWYREIEFRPQVVGDLTGAAAQVRSVLGLVGIQWQRAPDQLAVNVVIPVNARANVSIPKLTFRQLVVKEGDHEVWRGGKYLHGTLGVSGATEDADCINFQVGSGEYRFTILSAE
ncbi:MAG: family 78 glycoside hydrolase catalytic domain [Pirellulaceae bacterium]|nr:family 78 glycoside hydrolase catalytic domain [Pirellulaceae bacterium]